MVAAATLDYLGEYVALASSPRFLWRHLSRHPAIDLLSRTMTTEEFADQLTGLLGRDRLEGRELTLAYCLLIAWLLQSPSAAQRAGALAQIDRLPLARDLIDSHRGISQTSRLEVPLHGALLPEQRVSATFSGTMSRAPINRMEEQ